MFSLTKDINWSLHYRLWLDRLWSNFDQFRQGAILFLNISSLLSSSTVFFSTSKISTQQLILVTIWMKEEFVWLSTISHLNGRQLISCRVAKTMINNMSRSTDLPYCSQYLVKIFSVLYIIACISPLYKIT